MQVNDPKNHTKIVRKNTRKISQSGTKKSPYTSYLQPKSATSPNNALTDTAKLANPLKQEISLTESDKPYLTRPQLLKSKFFTKHNKYKNINMNYKKKDKILLNIAYSLLGIGLVMIVSSSYGATKVYSVANFHFTVKHIIFCIGNIFCMHFFANKLTWTERIGQLFWIAGLIGLVLVLIFSSSIKGANRWINIFGISIQPAEFIKIGVILEGAKYLGKNWPRFFITYLIPMSLIILQPDLGSTLILLCLACSQVIIKKFDIRYIIMGIGIFALMIAVSYFLFDHVQQRIDVFLNPSKDLYGAGYQRYKSFLAMCNGKLFGRGFGKGVIKDFLPDAHTDFVFSVIIEEFGFLGGLTVIALFMSLGYRVLRLLSNHEHTRVIQYSIIICILSSAWLNIASTLSLIPAKGLILPLISYGGSGLLAQGVMFGILLATTKQTNKFVEKIHSSHIDRNLTK